MDLTIKLNYADIKEVIEKENKILEIHFKNGDRITLDKSPQQRRLTRHLKKNFPGENLD